MRRFYELIALITEDNPDDDFFSDIEQKLMIIPPLRQDYQAYERAFSSLDSESWANLKNKAIKYFTDHREGQKKQGFFNQLNDAFAYQYLVRRGYKQVRVLCEDGTPKPDIEYLDCHKKCFCEVKTIGISDEVIKRRTNLQVTSPLINQELSTGFLNKFNTTLNIAKNQINKHSNKGLIFMLVHFDDFTLDYYDRYRKQIVTCLEMHSAENVYVKIGLTGRKYILKTKSEG